MVTVKVPAVAVAEAVSVRGVVVEAGLGLKDAVTPVGRPEADKLTLLLNPLRAEIAMVLPPDVPCVTATEAGEAERLKSGLADEPGQVETRLARFTVNTPVGHTHPT